MFFFPASSHNPSVPRAALDPDRFPLEIIKSEPYLGDWVRAWLLMLISLGTAITLLHSDEVHHFKELIQKTGREKIAKYNIKDDKLQSLVEKYQDTLERLQDAVKLESQKKSQQKGRHEIINLLQEQFMSNVLQRNSERN